MSDRGSHPKKERAGKELAGDPLEDASLIERAAARLREGTASVQKADATMPEKQPSGQGVHVNSLRGARRKSGHEIAPEDDIVDVMIDLDMLAAHGYLTPKTMRSQLAEEMRLIKRSVVQAFWFRDVERSNLIMVTSAFPSEGKSFVALNLAISLACEVDFHVLLVDSDFERPAVFNRLGLGRRLGLMDMLKNPDTDLSEIILRTNIERLSLIGPGRRDDMSTELLASQRMQQIAQEMADRYPDRLIIFDTPPMLSCSEPAVLAELMGQVVFVVESNKTQREALEKAVQLLPADCKLGLVLNKMVPGIGDTTYSYYGDRSYRNQI
ncbi:MULTISPECIES: XrtA-associated tyrosine autokinase [unclassified Iodidimonas]|uniref:XrtA-associated tyrosine autokinase n=1 Tax=unclassified Iodidimonas TaxID=2626145 RepID=UPI0024822F51|nr:MULTISPECIES: XrtA-associated tyrosine autokinase [unclassified Iodidimonas]